MRTPPRKSRLPEHHRSLTPRVQAMRYDLVFAVGVITDAVRRRPFDS
jgi:hypothetical protein